MASINPGAVFRKTAKGVEEIDKRTQRLGIKLRMALVLVNGQRDAAEIIVDVRDNGETLLAELLAGGFIEPATGSPAVSSNASPGAASAPALGALDLKTAQRTAVKAVEELLGPEGESLALKIERCKSADELQTILDKTRDLIRMSRGETRAQKFWDSVTKKG